MKFSGEYRVNANDMDVNSIVTIISSLGFPIVACVGMGWFVKYTTYLHNKDMKEERESHSAEVKQITEAIKNNTIVMERLIHKFDA